MRRSYCRLQQSLDAARAADERPLIDPPDPGPLPEQMLLQGELRARLERAQLALLEEWRLLVLLADVHELAYEEVARAAGISVGTVKSRLSRARARLREELRGELRPLAAQPAPLCGAAAPRSGSVAEPGLPPARHE